MKPVLGDGANRGKGAAVAAGARAAQGDLVLQVDVDMSVPLEDLALVAEAMRGGADMVVGTREFKGPKLRIAPRHRLLLGQTFNWVVRRMTGLEFRDTQCGFKLIPAATARELLATQVCTGFAYDVELLLRAQVAGLEVAAVPVGYVHDSRSSVRVGSASLRMLYDVARMTRRIKPKRG